MDVSSIRHYVMDGPFRNFDAFHRMSSWCPPIGWVLLEAHRYAEMGYAIVVVTAREDKWRELTFDWLEEHNVPFDGLWMRRTGDFRPDYEVKKEIYHDLTHVHDYDIRVALDDNPNVIRLWEEVGIPEIVTVPGWPAPVEQGVTL